MLAATIVAAVGLAAGGKPVTALIGEGDLDYRTRKTRLLMIGEEKAARDAFEWFHSRKNQRFTLSVVLRPAPDRGYPPPGEAYAASEAMYLWRWIGMHAPDVVVANSSELVEQLGRAAPAGTGTVPALRGAADRKTLRKLLAEWRGGPSPARLEIQRRLSRTPADVARQLSVRYGHNLDEAVYIPAVALMARLRLGALADVESIVAPYAEGRKNPLAKPTGSHFPGHLVFGELARLTGKARYVEMVKAAADYSIGVQALHNEMSDSVFMGCPILAQAGALTRDSNYFDQCVRHMRFMQALVLRRDGLYRHSPLDEAAWGRGNGFPALGLALSLADLPASHPGRAEMLRAFQSHMAALLLHQDEAGMWRQVIDLPGSYRELTATCMIAFAMSRGVKAGWLEGAKYTPAIERAWYGVRTRVAPDGSLVDVCTGTGKQPNLQAYLDRTAILGPDPRGGAMVLLLATELLGP